LSKLDERQRKQGDDIAEIKSVLKDQHRDIAKMQLNVARLDGRVSQLPTI